ncbi:MAG: hypothetical protein P1U58_16805 [Verrucomicrobiales bacterium]|nr:hypothetical protein [Verrucomicrobiales bacterium]
MNLLFPYSTGKHSQQGSILVVCMVLCALGTLGVAAWIALLDARGHQAEAGMEALKRRTVYANSRALAYRAIYANHLHADASLAADRTYTLPDNLGSATLRAFTTIPLEDNSAVRFSKSGITPFRTYTTDLTVDLADGIGTGEWDFQLRSYNPILGGDLFVMNPITNPTTGDTIVSGNLDVQGRAVFWDAVAKDFNGGIQANEFHLPNNIQGTTTFETPSGSAVLPLNYPIPFQTTGMSSTNPAYFGELDIAQSGSNSHNDYAGRLNATGNSVSMSGFTGQTVGPGPDTIADGPNDATLESEISTQSPATLMGTLPGNYPLSSRILNAVADKNNPAFTSDQLYQIYSDQIPVPDDAIAYLTSTHLAKISPRARELHEANGSAAYTDGAGAVNIVIGNPILPHVILTRAHEVTLIGQANAAAAAAAGALDPRGIVIDNTGTDSVHVLNFEERNGRRLLLSIATENNPTPPLFGYDAEMTFSGSIPFPNWEMIIDLENTGALIDTSAVAGATITGGIRANRKIDVVSGQLTLVRQFNHEGFESLLSRNAWVEAYPK